MRIAIIIVFIFLTFNIGSSFCKNKNDQQQFRRVKVTVVNNILMSNPIDAHIFATTGHKLRRPRYRSLN